MQNPRLLVSPVGGDRLSAQHRPDREATAAVIGGVPGVRHFPDTA